MTINIDELRRLAQAATPGPDGFSMRWLKLLKDFQEEANPATITELLDRLEAAESDCLEQVRLNGMGASREAALMAKLEAAEKERGIDEQRIADLMDELNRVGHENDALQAKVEAMERQEPVAWLHETRRDSDVVTDAVKHVWGKAVVGSLAAYSIPLYLAPGAQPTPIIPEGWKLVPTAESRHPAIYKMLGALHAVDNTPGASEWASYAAFLAAAPEAKP